MLSKDLNTYGFEITADEVEYLYTFHKILYENHIPEGKILVHHETDYFKKDNEYYTQKPELNPIYHSADNDPNYLETVEDEYHRKNIDVFNNINSELANLKNLYNRAPSSGDLRRDIEFHELLIGQLLRYFKEKGIKPEKLPELPKLGFELVKILYLEGKPIKANELVIKLEEKILVPDSYRNNISKIFQYKKYHIFFREEIVRNGGYWSLKSPDKHKDIFS